MASWASKRRFIYLSLIAGFFILIFSYPVFSLFYEASSCFDNKQNQDEIGVDCGGLCESVCEFETVAPVILWSKGLKVELGKYDAVAYVENPNVVAGVGAIQYSFKMYDESGVLVAERIGTTFINPNERFVIFEGAIETGKRIPARTFFEFTTLPQWKRALKTPPFLPIQNQVFTEESIKPKLKANMLNNSLDVVERIMITALIFDQNNNVIAASKTEVDRLDPQSSKIVSFLWPQPLSDEPTRIEITPRVNIMAR